MISSLLETALAAAGISADRIEWWLGMPCGCRERREKLDAVEAWARRIMGGRIEKAEKYLNDLLDD